MRRTALLLVCVLGLALAGCSGPSEEPPTVTPADPPTVETAEPTTETTTSEDPLAGVTVVTVTIDEPTPEPTARPDATFQGVEMPPGADERGIVNSDTLTLANARLLGETDFVLSHNETTKEWTNGTVQRYRMRSGTVAVSTDDIARYQILSVDQWEDTRVVHDGKGYIANGTEYHVENGTYQTSEITVPELRYSLARLTLDGMIGRGHWEPNGTTTVHDRAAIVFEFRPQVTPGASFDGRMVVDTRGLVHELTYRIEEGNDGGWRHLESVTYDLDSSASVDPEPPSWLPAAVNATEGDARGTRPTTTTIPG